MRVEDLDQGRSRPQFESSQLADLAAIGLDWDGPVVRQSERDELYEAAIERLRTDGLTYECYCTRRQIRAEIEASPSAPHLPPGAYPGTCRDLSDGQRAEMRATGRSPAIRLRTEGQRIEFDDVVAGPVNGGVDDLVLRRNDGTAAYNLAVVADDAEQSITEVVRGDDLLSSTPRHILLQRLLGYPTPTYVHVPLVVDEDGTRLAKRFEPDTLSTLAAAGVAAEAVVTWIAESLELTFEGPSAGLAALADSFDLANIPKAPVVSPRLT
jgi:glutamyl-tRNA synthetase